LAKVTGNPVLPFHLEADRHWTLNSWDRTQIPKPGSTVSLAMGAPIDVPADAGQAEVEELRVALEGSLERLERRARALLSSPTLCQ
jgi:lysophospholipid acyltransferase (LPLAT)-like uncharacterized protein